MQIIWHSNRALLHYILHPKSISKHYLDCRFAPQHNVMIKKIDATVILLLSYKV